MENPEIALTDVADRLYDALSFYKNAELEELRFFFYDIVQISNENDPLIKEAMSNFEIKTRDDIDVVRSEILSKLWARIGNYLDPNSKEDALDRACVGMLNKSHKYEEYMIDFILDAIEHIGINADSADKLLKKHLEYYGVTKKT